MTDAELDGYCNEILTDGFCVLRQVLLRDVIDNCARAFETILEAHCDEIRTNPNRGPNRHFIKLPFRAPFADAAIYENPSVLAIVDRLLGEDVTVGSYATDTPLPGSVYQELHGDISALFPEWEQIPPPYTLALNFPFVDVTEENGPFEAARGTHRFPRKKGIGMVEDGTVPLEPVFLNRGDAILRDPRHIHRGTPNRTQSPRPMAVITYVRKWFRFEHIPVVPDTARQKLSERGKALMRYAPSA